MRSRIPALGLGAIALASLAACGSEAGTGASSASTRVEISTPVYATAAPATTTTTIAGAVAEAGSIVAEEQQHTVVTGDYLYGIAKTYCVTAEQLIAYNAWPEGTNKQLYAGAIVKIPPGGCAPGSTPSGGTGTPTASSTASSTATSAATSSSVAPSGKTYTVVSGDYMVGIAKKNGVSVAALMAANGWSGDPGSINLQPGQTIHLPAEATG